jgi:hypothetical protein
MPIMHLVCPINQLQFFITMYGMDNVKIVCAQQAKMINNFINAEEK